MVYFSKFGINFNYKEHKPRMDVVSSEETNSPLQRKLHIYNFQRILIVKKD